MAKVYEIAFQMGGQITSTFNKSMRGANSALGDLQNQIKKLNTQQDEIGGLTKLQTSVGKLAREFNDAQAKAQKLGKELAATTNPTKKQQQEFERARNSAAKLKTQLRQQRESLSKLRTSMGATGKSTKQLANEQKELARRTETARKAQTSLQKTMAKQQQNVANRDNLRGQMLDAAALAVALGAPVRVAAQFEQQMAKVGAVSRASEPELKQLTKTARELGATTNWSASQTAEGMEFLAMSGFNTQQTMKAMPGMLDLASAGAIDLAQAADIASNILSGFKLEAEDMGRVGDVLTNTFTSSNTNLSMLGETMKYVAPIAAATNTSIEETAAMAGLLGNNGIQASQAGTSLRQMISRLAGPMKKGSKVLEELGITTKDAGGNLRPVTDILKDMDAAMKDMGTAAKTESIKAVFGMESAAAATILLGEAGSGSLEKYTQSLYEQGSATRVATKQNETAMGAMRRLNSATESIGITIGNALLPALASTAEQLAAAATVLNSFAQEFPTLTKWIVGGTAALIGIKVASIALGYTWTFLYGGALKIVTILKVMRTAWLLSTGAIAANTATSKAAIITSKALMVVQRTWTAITKGITLAQWALNAALLANPIGLVIAAVAGLVTAGVLLYQNWSKVVTFFKNGWTSIKGAFVDGINLIDSWLSNFSLYNSGKAIMKTLANGIISAAKSVIASVKGVFNKVRQYLPFSDAKVGPFSELTKSGAAIMNTIADGVNSTDNLQNSVNGQFKKANPANSLSSMARDAAQTSGGNSNSFTIEQHITIGGDATGDVEQQARRGASAGASDLLKEMQQAMNNERRLSYG